MTELVKRAFLSNIFLMLKAPQEKTESVWKREEVCVCVCVCVGGGPSVERKKKDEWWRGL